MKKTFCIIASGQSLNADDVLYVKYARDEGIIDGVIAVSNVGIDFAPWADALVSHDSTWWLTHKEAIEFKGQKFSALGFRGTQGFNGKRVGINSGMNSGLLAMFVARDIFKAEDIILLGFDMHGTHYFGPHTRQLHGKTLKNTDEKGFSAHIKQFEKFEGCKVVNCTPDSHLKIYPHKKLRDTI